MLRLFKTVLPRLLCNSNHACVSNRDICGVNSTVADMMTLKSIQRRTDSLKVEFIALLTIWSGLFPSKQLIPYLMQHSKRFLSVLRCVFTNLDYSSSDEYSLTISIDKRMKLWGMDFKIGSYKAYKNKIWKSTTVGRSKSYHELDENVINKERYVIKGWSDAASGFCLSNSQKLILHSAFLLLLRTFK